MKDYITKEYIELLEIDKMINGDKELLEIINEQQLDPKADRIVFATITIVLGIIRFLLSCRPPRGIEAYRILDNKMTNTIRGIVEDNTVKVYMLKSDVVNAFNMGTSDLYYTDKLIKKLSITENELISVCLHEYGHFVGKHIRHVEMVNTATGIIVPILIREITREYPMVVTVIISKIITFMINAHLRIKMGRPQEYFSDSYAAKKGYGKPLISALNKMNKYIRGVTCKDRTKEECDMFMERISKFDEHPTVEKRVENILSSSKIKSILKSGRFELLVRFLDRIKGFFRR